MNRTLLKLIVIFGLMLGLTVPGFAAKSEKQKKPQDMQDMKENAGEEMAVIKTEEKEITGQVSAISKDYIGVIYQTGKNSESEMGIYIAGTPQLERVKDLTQIQAGDTVTVEYEKVSEKDKQDNEFARHVVKKIIFVKKAPPPPLETDVLISDEEEQ